MPDCSNRAEKATADSASGAPSGQVIIAVVIQIITDLDSFGTFNQILSVEETAFLIDQFCILSFFLIFAPDETDQFIDS